MIYNKYIDSFTTIYRCSALKGLIFCPAPRPICSKKIVSNVTYNCESVVHFIVHFSVNSVRVFRMFEEETKRKIPFAKIRFAIVFYLLQVTSANRSISIVYPRVAAWNCNAAKARGASCSFFIIIERFTLPVVVKESLVLWIDKGDV